MEDEALGNNAPLDGVFDELFTNNTLPPNPTQGAGEGEYDPALALAAQHCYDQILSRPPPNDSKAYCPPVWDGWGCWDYTEAGILTNISCPSYMAGMDPSFKATKQCTINGTWWLSPLGKEWANYTSCINMDDIDIEKRVIYLSIAGYTISIIALLISIFVFTYFRQLQCDRVTLHKNLFTSYILSGISWILYYVFVALVPNRMEDNPPWCRALHATTQYFITCNFLWMFLEGLYLHTIIVVAFTKGKKLLIGCCITGWCLPLLTTIIYSAVRATDEEANLKCWNDDSKIQWIVFGFIVILLLANLLFLCNILRVLITKLKAVNSPDTNQTRAKAVKAILILIPLMGLQFILFPIQPPPDTVYYKIYMIASAFVTTFQGLFVAIIFCFCNGEVIALLKRKWRQRMLMKGRGGQRPSMMYTTTTYAGPDPDDNGYNEGLLSKARAHFKPKGDRKMSEQELMNHQYQNSRRKSSNISCKSKTIL